MKTFKKIPVFDIALGEIEKNILKIVLIHLL